MWHELYEWAFHWILLWIAFELGRRWNEKDVAASIAAITETQSRRWSQEAAETPEKVRQYEVVDVRIDEFLEEVQPGVRH